MARPRLIDIAKHEFGHWLSWKRFGGEVGSIELADYSDLGVKGAATIILDWETKSLSDVIAFTEARIITLLCGVYAQAYDGLSFNTDIVRHEFGPAGGGRLDWIKANEYMCVLKNMSQDATLENAHHRLDQMAANFTADNFSVIANAAVELSKKVQDKDKLYVFERKQIEMII
ncbi:hypothetical protein JT603_003881 [Escherichia coli]|uniref:hypothetical protein n=1 Tax=Escherichia coli TaxID=562 RepID=UPI000BE97674|nr:hypothetical protein [Escherichia coli]EHB5944610.1 hypothetical protein [Escherichia coli]EHC1975597.1 hypothetical protein [Escherichia coli]EHZ9981091.1 hypothetical protein [Escherichia coli]EIY0214866.1 hypothetical protein [Escherichia coli]EKK1109149.1 hypothetical protein [Escherichia coli]